MSEFRVVVGKRYYNGNGHIRGPLVENTWGDFQNTHPLRCQESDETFRVDGSYGASDGEISDYDLIAEVDDVPVASLQERIKQLIVDLKLLTANVDTLIEEVRQLKKGGAL